MRSCCMYDAKLLYRHGNKGHVQKGLPRNCYGRFRLTPAPAELEADGGINIASCRHVVWHWL